jgi:dihydrofolate reductase
MPRRIVATNYISLDGVIQDPVGMEQSGLGNWTGPFSRGPEGDRVKHEELMAAGAVLLGRVTYDSFAAVWPTVDDAAGFARRINSLPKYVASRSLEAADWNNTSIIEEDLVDAVRRIRNEDGGDILIYGSASLVHQLIPHDLVDEFRLMIFPVVLGRGTRLFPEGFSRRLKLIDNMQMGDGIVQLTFEPATAD